MICSRIMRLTYFPVMLLMLLCPMKGHANEITEPGDSIMSDFQKIIEDQGSISKDLSGDTVINLKEPTFAYVNFSGFEYMPRTKGSDFKGWIEFFDGEGAYFKKKIIADAQGTSSLVWPKKNLSIDICEDEWLGKTTSEIAFGEWVPQDCFHLKAYYTDYFRGLAVVAYQLYDDIIADHGENAHPWQRAGVDTADKRARCHPDGFPVNVYLNGEFYGVFSWQLKKHRTNMGQTKDCAEHIHLDGTLGDEFFKGTIDWTLFEIRNPKGLYCQDGSKYDGDHPKEIMDSGSEFFDPANESHVLSDKVKSYIKNLTTYVPHLFDLCDEFRSEQELREAVGACFDVQGLIDYTVFSAITNNVDGWRKNWQWMTYDGKKWYVEPYDLDMTFGNTAYGYIITEPEYQLFYDTPYNRFTNSTGPGWFIHRFFSDDLDRRYAELRESKVIDTDRLIGCVRNWYERIGEDNFEREYAKWNTSYCNRELIVDDNWSQYHDATVYPALPAWNDSTVYQKGDLCTAYNMVWIANNEVKGIHPCPQPGYQDSPERVYDWITRRVAMEDVLMNYKDQQSAISSPREEGGEKIRDEIFDVNGIPLSSLKKGVNIIRYKDGSTAKVLVQ